MRAARARLGQQVATARSRSPTTSRSRSAEGETLGILGPNGAGKTTLFNLISGDVRADAGRVPYDGQDITALQPHQRCRRGIGRSYQVPQPFGHMTVFENLSPRPASAAASAERAGLGYRRSRCCEQTGLMAHANKPAGALTLLDRKRLELARALATRPQLLLLDEIAGGLTEHEAQELVDELKRDQGERGHDDLDRARRACAARRRRPALVINFGAVLAEGAPRRR